MQWHHVHSQSGIKFSTGLKLEILFLGGTKATGQSNKKAPWPTSDKEYPQGWQWSKDIKAKPRKGQAMASMASV